MSKQRAAQIEVPPFLRELAAHAHAIDRIMHEPVRLHICSLLVDENEISFKNLQTKMGLNPGNVSAQMTRLDRRGTSRCGKPSEAAGQPSATA